MTPGFTTRMTLYLAGMVLLANHASLGIPERIAAAADTNAHNTSGSVNYHPAMNEDSIPDRFRLPPHEFTYSMRSWNSTSKVAEIYDVAFPSPVTTTTACNNTVHCEYFQPREKERVPAVIVLHILGGDFQLSRLFCLALNQKGVACLFLKMPYYGPRRDPGSPRRMIDSDPDETIEGMTQAILDIRRATAWLASRPEVDPRRLGIFGISLGGITGSLAASSEPRLGNVCLLLAGGNLAGLNWNSRELRKLQQQWQSQGTSVQDAVKKLEIIDPVQHAPRLQGRRVLMLNAEDDELIPRSCAIALWDAAGRPEIIWYPGDHYSVIWQLPRALERVCGFFATP